MFHVEQCIEGNTNNKHYMIMTQEDVKGIIRNVPDFPKKGILFKDLTTAFINPECMHWFEEQLTAAYAEKGITKVLGIESRGFVMAPIVANRLGVGFVPVRKKGKLPADVVEQTYEKEYGTDTIEIHKDSLTQEDVVMIHDDLLATGGTMAAAVELVRKFGVKRIYVSFLVELDDLEGRRAFADDVEVLSLIHY